MPDLTRPFPLPDGFWSVAANWLGDRSLAAYIGVFAGRRDDRPGRTLADVDLNEMFRLVERNGTAHPTQTKYLRDLSRDHADFFADAASRQRVLTFCDNHENRNTARDQDRLVREILDEARVEFFREPRAGDFITNAIHLVALMRQNRAHFEQHGIFDPALTDQINATGAGLSVQVAGLTLTDVDQPDSVTRSALARDLHNLVQRMFGTTDHESRFKDGRWENWNRDIVVFPETYREPAGLSSLVAEVKGASTVRMVAGGHAFNIASSMGGTKDHPFGTLITLDRYRLDGGSLWERVPAQEARQKYNVPADDAMRIVRVSAGMRLRDFGKAMWKEGLALPVAGSTDAQSLAGLLATDLHSTGRTAGFLSSQVLEVVTVDGLGRVGRYLKDESVARGTPGRWRWFPDDTAPARQLRWLTVSGALGTAGVVAEVVLKLDDAYRMRKVERFVPITWAESHIHRFLDVAETDPEFAFDHVSFYYGGGDARASRTVRMNAWKRTTEPLTGDYLEVKTIRELMDHVGSALLPDALNRLTSKDADDWPVRALNDRDPLILPANEAFARKLFFQHDEIEVGVPLAVGGGTVDYSIFRRAIRMTRDLLVDQEFKSVIEVRFTPDTSEGVIGPGAGSATCYIELATPFGLYSRDRIVQVFQQFDKLMRDEFGARPHLGKKTSVSTAEMSALFGARWQELSDVRAEADPNSRFLPPGNLLLRQIFVA